MLQRTLCSRERGEPSQLPPVSSPLFHKFALKFTPSPQFFKFRFADENLSPDDAPQYSLTNKCLLQVVLSGMDPELSRLETARMNGSLRGLPS